MMGLAPDLRRSYSAVLQLLRCLYELRSNLRQYFCWALPNRTSPVRLARFVLQPLSALMQSLLPEISVKIMVCGSGLP